MPRGKLIVFEGLDRAGKSTQCEMLVEALRKDGVPVRHVRFPGTFTYLYIYMVHTCMRTERKSPCTWYRNVYTRSE